MNPTRGRKEGPTGSYIAKFLAAPHAAEENFLDRIFGDVIVKLHVRRHDGRVEIRRFVEFELADVEDGVKAAEDGRKADAIGNGASAVCDGERSDPTLFEFRGQCADFDVRG